MKPKRLKATLQCTVFFPVALRHDEVGDYFSRLRIGTLALRSVERNSWGATYDHGKGIKPEHLYTLEIYQLT